MDIDILIKGPDNKIVHKGKQETSGKYTFAAHAAGDYTYCFSNEMSTMTPKVVMFNMQVGEAPKRDVDHKDGDGATKLEDMISELSGKFVLSKPTDLVKMFPLYKATISSRQAVELFSCRHSASARYVLANYTLIFVW